MKEDAYHIQSMKEIETYHYRNVHGPVIVVTSDSTVKGMSIHGPIIVAPTAEDASLLLTQWTEHTETMEKLRNDD